MFILLICNSLASTFTVEIDENAIAVIYIDLISCFVESGMLFF